MAHDHSRLRELFIEACDLPVQQQDAWVNESCSDDDELRSELLQLLRSDAAKDGLFADDKITDGVHFQLDTVAEHALPAFIAQYRVKNVLGEGGMGIVYLAEQQNPTRDVAVKVIRSGMLSPSLLKRFEIEAEVLGRLTHPGIASIHEAGIFIDQTNGHSRPFLAMEYVDGRSLREFIQHTAPSTSDRLKLFVQICNAVHHAHQRGVIHRDLKPGNVLVRRDGRPVILDFGVARAAEIDLKLSTLQTQAGQLIGTLPYMSPEQVSGRALDVDVRSDVYALGVIVYELLSGQLPYEIHDLDYLNAAKVISNAEPIPIASIQREFRGDLNTIVLKALEKAPDRRYQSAAALGDDIQRYLNNEPVLARPVTAVYQLRQFTKRNRTLVAGVLVSIALLVCGVVGTTIGMLNAWQETARKDAINRFMTDILVSTDSVTSNPNVKMTDVLREAAASAPQRFRDYPELEAEVSYLLGTAFARLSVYSDAIVLYRRAYELRKEEHGLSHALTREAGAGLASIMAAFDATATIALAGNLLEHTPPNEMQGIAAVRLQLAIARAKMRLNELDSAEQKLRQILANVNAIADFDRAIKRKANVSLATVLWHKVHRGMSDNSNNDLGEAIQLFRASIVDSVAAHGESHEYTLRIMLTLVDALRQDVNELQAAEQLSRQVIMLAGLKFDAEHEFNVRPKKDLAQIYYLMDSYVEAAEYLVDCIEIRVKQGDEIGLIVDLTDGLPIIEAAGRFVEGEEYARIMLKKMPIHNGNLTTFRLYLARFLSGQGQTATAENEFEQVIASGQLESDDSLKCLFNLFMGEHYLASGNRSRAAELFDEALRLRKLQGYRSHPRIARIENAIKRASPSIDVEE